MTDPLLSLERKVEPAPHRFAAALGLAGESAPRTIPSVSSATSLPSTPESESPEADRLEINLLVMPERLDAAAVDQTRAHWEARPLHVPLIVDLARTHFLDSTGLGFLIRLRRLSREHGTRFALANVPPSIQRTIGLMKLSSMFVFGSSVEDAIQRAI